MLKIAPTLIVEKVEPTLNFLITRLGFNKVVEVPGEAGLDFALLNLGTLEIHLQAKKSAGKDIPYLGDCKMPPASFLYIDVENVNEFHEKLKDCDIVLPLQKTFYGATHFFIREPGGHVLGFSQNE